LEPDRKNIPTATIRENTRKFPFAFIDLLLALQKKLSRNPSLDYPLSTKFTKKPLNPTVPERIEKLLDFYILRHELVKPKDPFL